MSHSGPTAGHPAFHEAADRQLHSHPAAVERSGALGLVDGGPVRDPRVNVSDSIDK
jgi:hypothetical protein